MKLTSRTQLLMFLATLALALPLLAGCGEKASSEPPKDTANNPLRKEKSGD